MKIKTKNYYIVLKIGFDPVMDSEDKLSVFWLLIMLFNYPIFVVETMQMIAEEDKKPLATAEIAGINVLGFFLGITIIKKIKAEKAGGAE
jgi:hypothetical protein